MWACFGALPGHRSISMEGVYMPVVAHSCTRKLVRGLGVGHVSML